MIDFVGAGLFWRYIRKKDITLFGSSTRKKVKKEGEKGFSVSFAM